MQVTGELEALGFDEIEPGIVEDSSENKKRIRRLDGDWYWEQVRDEDGQPTGLIRVLSPVEMTRRRDSVYERRKDLLVDPEDAWSDYKHPDSYPLEPDVPYFILERLSKWQRQARNGVPEEERQPFPARCEIFRHDGTRCWNWASNPVKLPRCTPHAGWTAQAEQRHGQYAKQRILESAPDAADSLIELALYAEGEAVKLKATTEILDRAGVRGGIELDVHHEVEVVDPSIAVKAKLDQLAERGRAKAELEARTRDTVPGEVIANDAGPEPDGSRATD